MRERIAWLDFAKGIAIIVVVWGHAVVDEIDANKFFAVFRMPFFFVTAGFLLNLDKWSGAENYKKFSAKLVKRLLVPYYLAELLWYPIWLVVCHKAGFLSHLWDWESLKPLESFLAIFFGNGNDKGLILGQLWFLPALFFTEIIFIKLYNRLNRIGAEVFVAAIFLAGGVGLNSIILPMGIDVALAAQIFIFAGVLIRRYNFVDKLTPINCAVLTLILIASFYSNELVNMNFRVYGNGLLFYSGGLAGTFLVMKISALMTDGKIFSLISDCGRQSMMILVLHPIIANVLFEVLAQTTTLPHERFLTEPTIIFAVTAAGVLIPLFVAKKFGKLPVMKYFCP